MNKLISFSLCFIVSICAGFKFTSSDDSKTNPLMWCNGDKKDQFKNLYNDTKKADADNQSLSLMKFFTENVKNKNIAEEYGLKIPNHMSCRFLLKEGEDIKYMISAFIELIKANHDTNSEKLTIQSMDIIMLTSENFTWKDSDSFLQINKCKFSGFIPFINCQYFPCDTYSFEDIIHDCPVYLPTLHKCNITVKESKISINIEKDIYNANQKYTINIDEEKEQKSSSPSVSSDTSSDDSYRSNYNQDYGVKVKGYDDSCKGWITINLNGEQLDTCTPQVQGQDLSSPILNSENVDKKSNDQPQASSSAIIEESPTPVAPPELPVSQSNNQRVSDSISLGNISYKDLPSSSIPPSDSPLETAEDAEKYIIDYIAHKKYLLQIAHQNIIDCFI